MDLNTGLVLDLPLWNAGLQVSDGDTFPSSDSHHSIVTNDGAAGAGDLGYEFVGGSEKLLLSDEFMPDAANNRTLIVVGVMSVIDNDVFLSYGNAAMAGARFECTVGYTSNPGHLRLVTSVHNYDATDTFNVNERHMFAFVIQDKYWYPYVDAVLDSGGPIATPLINTVKTGSIYVGRSITDNHTMEGYLFDIKFFNRALSAAEISFYYQLVKERMRDAK